MTDTQLNLLPDSSLTPKILGITITDPWRVRSVAAQLRDLGKELGRKPFIRLVFDEGIKNPSDYTEALQAFRPHVAGIMGELLDSFYIKDLSVEKYVERCTRYVSHFQGLYCGEKLVDIWEQNEINGPWTYDDDPERLPEQISKISTVHGLIHSRGEKSALCFYDDPEESWEPFGLKLPALTRGTADWVLMSSYPHDNEGFESDWIRTFDRLGRLFPSPTTQFLIGECGMEPKNFSASARAQTINHYYGKDRVLRFPCHPRFIGGGFEWYQDDILKNLRPEFVRAVRA